MAPAPSRSAIAVASCSARKYSGTAEPHAAARPPHTNRSLWASGTPWSGPRARPAFASASRTRAVRSAPSASTWTKARSRGPRASMRARHSSVASTGEISLARIRAASAARLVSITAGRLRIRGRLAGWRTRLEGRREACRLLGEPEIRGGSLDPGDEVGKYALPGTLGVDRQRGDLTVMAGAGDAIMTPPLDAHRVPVPARRRARREEVSPSRARVPRRLPPPPDGLHARVAHAPSRPLPARIPRDPGTHGVPRA